MRHRTALPFLDAFLKPTKHIRSGLFLHYMVCNFCEIEIKNHSQGIFGIWFYYNPALCLS